MSKGVFDITDLQMFRDLSLITVGYKEDIRNGMDCYQSGESVVLGAMRNMCVWSGCWENRSKMGCQERMND